MIASREGKWEPPSVGMCNFDDAVSTHGAFIGFGFIVRNSRGGVIVAKKWET